MRANKAMKLMEVIWGGYYNNGADHFLNDGARFNPGLNTWTTLTTNGAPSGRSDHTAVWTGREMIIWGGTGNGFIRTGDGARYDPALDHWTPVGANGAPSSRNYHSAVWTGSEMIIW